MSLDDIFGSGKDLAADQMASRAFVLFLVTLALIRIGGMRAFGRKSSFDTIIVIMLGAVLSRAVTGASPVLGTVLAGLVLVLVHRLFAMLTARFPAIEHLVKGRSHHLYRDGVLQTRAMDRAGISRADLEEAVRRLAGRTDLHDVEAIFLESSGELSVIRKGERTEAPARRASNS